jgi:hypothetical protein
VELPRREVLRAAAAQRDELAGAQPLRYRLRRDPEPAGDGVAAQGVGQRGGQRIVDRGACVPARVRELVLGRRRTPQRVIEPVPLLGGGSARQRVLERRQQIGGCLERDELGRELRRRHRAAADVLGDRLRELGGLRCTGRSHAFMVAQSATYATYATAPTARMCGLATARMCGLAPSRLGSASTRRIARSRISRRSG